MKKSYIITAACALLAVLLTVAVVLRDDLTALITQRHTDSPSQTTDFTVPVDTESYTALVKGTTDMNSLLLPTDQRGIYYSLTTTGEVSFYKIENYTPVKLPASGEYEITVESGFQDLSARVSYYTGEDGRTTGYGLFLPDNNPEVYIYDYAFFKLTDLPDSFSSSGSMLVLLDTDKEDFLKADKTYEEPFIYNVSNGRHSRLLSADNRAIDDRGAPRADYCMLTDAVIEDCLDEILFFSSRHYHLFDTEKKLDIFSSGGSGNNKDNIRLIKDVVDFYAKNSEDGVLYLGRTDTGFALKCRKSEEDETVIKEFLGDFATGYLRYKDIILNRQTLECYDISTGESFTIALQGSESFIPNLLEINENGSFFMRGVSANTAAIAVGNIKSGGSCYHNELFKNITAPCFLADNQLAASVAKDESGTAFSLLVLEF